MDDPATPTQTPAPYVAKATPTVLTDVDIPFGRLVVIIVKLVLASIPAYLILLAIFFTVFLILGALFGGVWTLLPHHYP